MQMFIKTLNGKTLTCHVVYNENVDDLKVMIFEKEGISTEQQRLLFSGKQLEDSRTIGDYNIQTLAKSEAYLPIFDGANTLYALRA